jgi:UDP-N-acetylmuramyl pentapeptide phosphotransferase/UDP-N-acetylglucosamine-1-phosphate transferase
MSDLDYLKSPIKRFFLQIVLLIIFVNLSDKYISSLRIPAFDKLLEYEVAKNIITISCYMVLINGSNFIDGVNTLVLGYFIGISVVFYLIIQKFGFKTNLFLINYVLALLIVLFAFNFFGKLFLGDGGVYLIALIYGYYGILLTNLYYKISPYCIAALFWYPAFECFFSIIRKFF